MIELPFTQLKGNVPFFEEFRNEDQRCLFKSKVSELLVFSKGDQKLTREEGNPPFAKGQAQQYPKGGEALGSRQTSSRVLFNAYRHIKSTQPLPDLSNAWAHMN
jgi:hypothetical protein